MGRLERWRHIVPLRLRSLFRRDQAEQDLADELSSTSTSRRSAISAVASRPSRRTTQRVMRCMASKP